MRSEPTEFNNSCVSTDCYAVVDEVCRTGVRIFGQYKAVGGRYLFHAGRRSDDETMNAYWYSSEQNCCLSTCCSYIIYRGYGHMLQVCGIIQMVVWMAGLQLSVLTPLSLHSMLEAGLLV